MGVNNGYLLVYCVMNWDGQRIEISREDCIIKVSSYVGDGKGLLIGEFVTTSDRGREPDNFLRAGPPVTWYTA